MPNTDFNQPRRPDDEPDLLPVEPDEGPVPAESPEEPETFSDQMAGRSRIQQRVRSHECSVPPA